MRIPSAFPTSALFLFLTGCTAYEFTPVSPIALVERNDAHVVGAQGGLRPDIMMLVDRSGSMKTEDVQGQASRLGQVQSTMKQFLGANPTVARFGVVAFSSLTGTSSCSPAQLSDIAGFGVDIPNTDDLALLSSTSAKVNTMIQGLSPGGSTPTAESLRNLASYGPLTASDPGRDRFVLLMTDGLPNCNPDNPNNSCTVDNPLCRCTGNGCTPSKPTTCARDCLDADASVAAVTTLRNANIKTIVIGFGAETAQGDAADTLNGMALAGGFERTCPNGQASECNALDPSDGCDLVTHTCLKRFYQARNGDQLASALAAIIGRLPVTCKYTLTQIPEDPRFLSVSVNGVSVAPSADTWAYANGVITFPEAGPICKQLNSSTKANPVTLEFRILNHL